MMLKIDFLSYIAIAKYLIVFTIILMAGTVLKDIVAILFVSFIILFGVTKNLYKALELFLIWFFIYNFYLGQSFLSIGIISKYIAKPPFLLFVIFIFFYTRIPLKVLKSHYLKTWIFFLFITLLSAILHSQSPFVVISLSSIFLLYLLLMSNSLSIHQYQNILNLFVAAAILQTMVSLLQISELIPPPSKMMDDGSGGQFEWLAGLDDAASGTFGPGASHMASWYGALISLFLLITWSITKNKSYLIFAAIAFLQFATTDSKTIMGVTILMFSYLFLYLYKKKNLFKLNIQRYFVFILIIGLGGMGFFKAWNTYYEYFGAKTGGSRTNLSAVYENEARESQDLIITNISDWGKIRGFTYVTEDFIATDPKQLIWGYGIQGYKFNGKMGYIENKDTPLMQLNNLTKSRSGLIKQFAISGFLGFILLITSIIQWYRLNNKKNRNKFDLLKSSMLNIYVSFSLLAAFLYQIDITTIPIISFFAIIAIYTKLSDASNIQQFLIKY
ncbi:hypothetical protein [Lutimonas zeaxanthinifaciens]|uniref:hypothetical protein n=1 Tax=Lutimonas zeaxanthinifaciens TaxID=3060215 RepID=UPI00265D0FD5|nr:hypothetical protein [Lutimonas sp. YSD2104]WKK66463.1 hypothetical protein QZH61_02310 [Lutimonas sp. YSD2104]